MSVQTKKKTVVLTAFAPGLRANANIHRASAPYVLRDYLLKFPDISDHFDIRVKTYDLDDNEEVVLRDLYSNAPHVAGFTCYFWTAERVRNVSRKLKLVLPGVCVVLGGPQVGPELISDWPWVDFAVRGEGEATLRTLLTALARNRNPRPAPGLLMHGAPADTPPAILEDLRGTPLVIRDPQFLKRARNCRENELPIETSRGCAFKCAYCGWASGRVRYHSLRDVEHAVKFLIRNAPDDSVQYLEFVDSYMDMNLPRLKKILQILIKYKQPHVMCRGYFLFRNVDDEALDLMEQANFRHLRFGLQTLRLDLMRAMNRAWFSPQSLDRLVAVRRRFTIHVDLLYGLPGDSYKNFRDTMLELWNRGVDHISAFRLRALPGTGFAHGTPGLRADTHPPHLVWAAPGFPFEDIFSAERFGMALRVLTRLLRRADFVWIQDRFGLGLGELAEGLSGLAPAWDALIRKEGGGNIDCAFEPAVADLLWEFIRARAPVHGENALDSLLALRRAECALGRVDAMPLRCGGAYSVAGEADLKHAAVFVPAYERLTLGWDVVEQGPAHAARFTRPRTVFLARDFCSGAAHSLHAPEPDVLDMLLKFLSRPRCAPEVERFMADRVRGLRADSVRGFLRRMARGGVLLLSGES